MRTLVYRAFGFNMASEIPLPEVLLISHEHVQPDVRIMLGDLQDIWNEYGKQGEYYAYLDEQFLLYVPEIAIFSVRGGEEITVSPLNGAKEHQIRLYLLGTCMGAILMQKRILPLHGSAVVIDGKGYAFIGESGAGKSTLACGLIQRGYSLLSDDVIAISWGGPDRQIPIVIPSYPQQKLWQESFDYLGMSPADCENLYETKYALPVPQVFQSDRIPLGGIFELNKSDQSGIQIKACSGLQCLPILHMHTYRNFLLPLLAKNNGTSRKYPS
ncbi:HPr kinase/phosphorylase [Paenibacillus hexagrammi]|uniref:Aldolase n=1 Tax=Paenibacillus hexagrammi TaxID=2908839 RepID=A0ABY3SJP9_9BACL|nr:aldolase [Paenibacillus sp. YPD9-1]UJF33934.1 aldolase [Paenibacillus sp. YPD9-1]